MTAMIAVCGAWSARGRQAGHASLLAAAGSWQLQLQHGCMAGMHAGSSIRCTSWCHVSTRAGCHRHAELPARPIMLMGHVTCMHGACEHAAESTEVATGHRSPTLLSALSARYRCTLFSTGLATSLMSTAATCTTWLFLASLLELVKGLCMRAHTVLPSGEMATFSRPRLGRRSQNTAGSTLWYWGGEAGRRVSAGSLSSSLRAACLECSSSRRRTRLEERPHACGK